MRFYVFLLSRGRVYTGFLLLTYCHVLRMSSVTNNSTGGSDWISDLFAMEIYSCYKGYHYNEHYSTVSFSDPTDGTALLWRLTSRTELFWLGRLTPIQETNWPKLTSEADWLTLIPVADCRRLTNFSLAFFVYHSDGPIENLAFLLLVTMEPTILGWLAYPWKFQLRLPSNDGLRSNT
jgi:hypothetical protein